MSLKDTIRTRPRLLVSAGLITVGLAGGAVLGTTLTASAATSPTSTTSSSGSASMPTPPQGSMPAPGSAAHEDAETPVTGADAAKAQAAAVKYVGSGTAGAVTTDFTKSGYEVTVTKADGTKVEVHLDSSFQVMQGGPGGRGGHFGPGGPGAPAGSAPPSGSAPSSAAA